MAGDCRSRCRQTEPVATMTTEKPAVETVPVVTFRPMAEMPGTLPTAEFGKFPDDDLPAWRAKLIAAGVTPHRVASPDLTGQLQQAGDTKIDTLICSVLDTDPSVPFNSTVAAVYTAELAAGLALLMKLTAAPRLWISADPDKPSDWFPAIRSKIDHKGLRLVPLRGDYPQTDPTLMLYTLLQRRLGTGKLPPQKGAVLVDAATAVAVGRCVLAEGSVRQTPIALRDHFSQVTHLVDAPMGARLIDLLEFLDCRHSDAVYRSGDFLRDAWITPETALGNGELIIHATARHLNANPDPCIRCGWCLEACPTRIHPAGLLEAAQENNLRAAKKFGLDACIECGICSYVCPTRLPLLTAIQGLKKSSKLGHVSKLAIDR